MTDSESKFNPERKDYSLLVSQLLELADRLGLNPVPKMELEKPTEWRSVAEQIAETNSGQKFFEAQIAVCVADSAFALRSGNIDAALQSLDEAQTFAFQMDLIELVKILNQIENQIE